MLNLEPVVYELGCSVNGMVYIGETTKYYQRKYQHLMAMSAGTHPVGDINRDVAIFGIDAFSIKVLERIDPLPGKQMKRHLLSRERYWIDISRQKNIPLYNTLKDDPVVVAITKTNRVFIVSDWNAFADCMGLKRQYMLRLFKGQMHYHNGITKIEQANASQASLLQGKRWIECFA